MSGITDSERCEVAESLRNLGFYGGVRYAEQFYELLCEAVMDLGGFHEFRDVAHRLADLVEPAPERACRDVGGEEGTNGEHYDFACSECGYCCDLPEPSYCPGCGAIVVEGEP